jgi:hypothetical protein
MPKIIRRTVGLTGSIKEKPAFMWGGILQIIDGLVSLLSFGFLFSTFHIDSVMRKLLEDDQGDYNA